MKSRPVVLADAEDVEPELIRELDLLEQIGQPLLLRDRPARLRIGRAVGERIEAKLHAPTT